MSKGSEAIKKKHYEQLILKMQGLGMRLLTPLSEYESRKPNVYECCSSGHRFTRMTQMWKRTTTCPICSTRTGVTKPLEEILKRPAFKGFHVEGEYLNLESVMTITCPYGHMVNRKLRHFTGCAVCSSGQRSSGVALRESILSNGYRLIDEIPDRVFYDGYKHKQSFVISCPKGHEFRTYYRAWFELNYRCGQCAHSANDSRGQNEIRDWLKNLGYAPESGYRILDGKNIDIYLQDHRLGIEFNGVYHHTKYPPNYHRDKHRTARTLGITLLSFWEDEWYASPEIVRSIILSKLKSDHIQRIAARDTQISRVKPATALEFFARNHLQGPPSNLKNCLGLIHQGELVMAVAIGTHHRNHAQLVLTRLAAKTHCTVVGGFAKLLAQMPRPLVTWSDNRISQGRVYAVNGFVLDEELDPDYVYVKGGQRFSKQSLRKTTEERSSGGTELELRTEQGYRRLYDAGKVRWILR